MSNLYFESHNKGKINSATKYSKKYNQNFTSIDLSIEEPDGISIEETAVHKVMSTYQILKEPCFANDSGFYIEGYPLEKNFPGPYTNRKLLIPIGIEGLIRIMNGIENRNCYFEDCVAFYDGNELKTFRTFSKGKLSTSISEKYNPIEWSPLWKVFIPDGYNKVLSEFTSEELKERDASKESSLNEFFKWYSHTYEKRLNQ